MKLPGTMLAFIESAFNKIIADQPGIIGDKLPGHCVCMKLDGLDLPIYFRFTNDAVFLFDDHEQPPDTTIQGTPLALLASNLSGEAHTRDLKIDGDLQIAQGRTEIQAQRAGGLRRHGQVVAFRVGTVQVFLDLAVDNAVAAGEGEVLVQGEGEIDFRALQFHLVDVRHHPQQAEGTGEEVEELVVVDLGIGRRLDKLESGWSEHLLPKSTRIQLKRPL